MLFNWHDDWWYYFRGCMWFERKCAFRMLLNNWRKGGRRSCFRERWVQVEFQDNHVSERWFYAHFRFWSRKFRDYRLRWMLHTVWNGHWFYERCLWNCDSKHQYGFNLQSYEFNWWIVYSDNTNGCVLLTTKWLFDRS